MLLRDLLHFMQFTWSTLPRKEDALVFNPVSIGPLHFLFPLERTLGTRLQSLLINCLSIHEINSYLAQE